MYNEVDGTTPTSNRPLRGGKGNNWDGGVRVPCIAVWPGHIEKKSKSRELVTSTDFYPTILDLLEIPKKESQTFDGISIRPALEGKPMDKRYIFTYFPHATKVPDTFPNSAAIYENEWKLICLLHNAPNGDHEHWLFHLKNDIGEKNEVSKKYPNKVAELSSELDRFLAGTGAIYPTPNPNYDPNKASSPKPKKKYSATQFKRMDKNKEGFLNLKEFIGNPEGRNVPALKKQFSRRDTNADGKLTLAELNK
jgi:arylsulfatase A-like enzyme